MKKHIFLLALSFFSLAAAAQAQVVPNASKNYIHSITYKTGSTEAGLDTVSPNNKIENISYFDGLGRPVQSVAVRQGGKDNLTAEADLYTHIEYDAYGREIKKYLPLPSAQNDGRFITDPVTAITNYYTANYAADLTGTVNPYAEARFEASPLNRVLEQGAPGADWAVNATADTDHTIKFDYQANTASDVVFRYDVSLTADYTPTLTQPPSPNNVYLPGTLYKTVTKDENWQPGQTYLKDHTTEEFKDLQGRVILKRTYNSTPPLGEPEGAGAHDTYYVYDDYGNLTYVLPPKVVTSDGVSATELAELCYQYKYDGRNRLVEKKIPGKGWEYIVYNKLDQPVLTQDANLQAQAHWLFTKYDAFGRVAYTGKIETDNADRVAMQTAADLVMPQFETRSAPTTVGGITLNYTSQSFPLALDPNLYGISEILTINYYDDYDFDLDGGVSETAYGLTPITNAKGLPTGSKVRVLGSNDWTTTVTYYDDKARPIYVYAKNDYLNTTDKVKSWLDFIGKPLETSSVHTKDGLTTTVIEKFTYDHADRLLAQTHQINSAPAEMIVRNRYDELGQLIGKGVGGKTTQTALQDVDYAYNIRGWLKQINDVNNIGTVDLFAFKLGYNEGTSPLYNGNISLTQWKTRNTDSSLKTYNYTYDALNRITSAINTNANYNLDLVNYDKNGNIMHLKRNGHRDVNVTSFGLMDDLTYAYVGNQLQSVNDSNLGSAVTGFIDGAETTTEYVYDTNGNMTSDANKGITNVVYNHLNMPANITVTGSNAGTLDYAYDATGIKLRKANNNGMTTDYSGNFVYENGNLKQISHAEGYIEPNGGTFQYVYYLKDHQNNVRVTFADDNNNGVIETGTSYTEIRREQNYFPFGMEHRGYNNVSYGVKNNLKTYQDQEFTEDLGLNTHEWRFRVSDPAIGRFWQVDPIASDYVYNSTYAFSENRVIDGVELEGLEYVNANEAKIEVHGGKVKLKTENLNIFTRSDIRRKNRDPKFWNMPNSMGYNVDVGSFSITYRNPIRGARNSQMKIQNPISQSTGQEDQRFKDRFVGGVPTGVKARSSARGLAIVAAIDFGLRGTEVVLAFSDINDVENQQNLLRFAFEDLKSAIEQGGMIDSEFLNEFDLSDILNVIFQGESITNNPKTKEIGDNIFSYFNIYKPVLDRIRSQQKAEKEMTRRTKKQLEELLGQK